MSLNPVVIDVNHANRINVDAVARAGIVAIIHKASQGAAFADEAYALRRKMARTAGLEWGAYHFNSGQAVNLQVEQFFKVADPDERTVMVLDYEDNNRSPMMFRQMIDFLGLADQKLGRPVDLYSGNRIKEAIAHANIADISLLAERRLWLCQYGPTAKLQDVHGRKLPWSKYWLWQYTGDGEGLPPHTVSGAEPGTDLSVFSGTPEELRASWVPLTS